MVEPYLMPLVQGYTPGEYAAHAETLAEFVDDGAWVGVGSVCKRQGDPAGLAEILEAILAVNGTWRLHGFGVKATGLSHPRVKSALATADSMAWSFAARYERLRDPSASGPNAIESCLLWLREVEQC